MRSPTENALGLADTLDTAGHTALAEQLVRAAQVQLRVQRVRMRDERPSGRTAVQQLQDRRFHLGVSTPRTEPQGVYNGRPRPHHITGSWAHDEADITAQAPVSAESAMCRRSEWPRIRARQRPCPLRGNRPRVAITRSSPCREVLNSPVTGTMSGRSTTAFHSADRPVRPRRGRAGRATASPSPSRSAFSRRLPASRETAHSGVPDDHGAAHQHPPG